MSVRSAQLKLREHGFDPGEIDGRWGTKSDAALDAALAQATRLKIGMRRVQRMLDDAGYPPGPLDGEWGPRTANALQAAIDDRRAPANDESAHAITAPPLRRPGVLGPADLAEAAASLGVTVAHIKAVIAVESGGGWFTDVRAEILDLDGPGGFIDGEWLPKILFEAHLFSRYTGGRFDKMAPDLSSPSWNRALYIGGQAEWRRLHRAMLLDESAALRAASWGMFQILGANHRVCGYDSARAFAEAMKLGEREHLLAFVGFVKGNGLAPALRANDWAAFARGYNGPSYETHGYHTRLAAAFAKEGGR